MAHHAYRGVLTNAPCHAANRTIKMFYRMNEYDSNAETEGCK
jgi:hypothetical protein